MQDIIEAKERLADELEAHNREMHEQIMELTGKPITLSPYEVQAIFGMSREAA